MADRLLPSLPPSDPASLQQNRWDPNYNTRAANFWKDQEVTYTKEQPFKKCKHYFVKTDKGIICNKCHFGLTSNMTIQDGKLVIDGRPIEL